MKVFFTLFFCCFLISLSAQLKLDNNNRLSLNYDGSQIGAGSFFISGNSTYSGMYVNNESATGNPFYGYSINGLPDAYHYYNGVTQNWRLFVKSNTILNAYSDSLRINGILNSDAFKTIDLSLSGDLSVIDGADSIFLIKNQTESMLFNRTQPINVFTDFTLGTIGSGFGGMYVDAPNDITGKPFYGYSLDGLEYAFHYFDAEDLSWKLFVNTSEKIIIDDENINLQNDNLLFNAPAALNEFTDFTLGSTKPTFGGMYIDSPNNTTAKPFYGYSLDGSEIAFHCFDAEDFSWKLYVETLEALRITDQLINLGTEINVEGHATVANYNGSFSDLPIGSIYFNNGHFYGKLNATTFRQLDNNTNLQSPNENQIYASKVNTEIDKLKAENQELKKELKEMKALIMSIQKTVSEE